MYIIKDKYGNYQIPVGPVGVVWQPNLDYAIRYEMDVLPRAIVSCRGEHLVRYGLTYETSGSDTLAVAIEAPCEPAKKPEPEFRSYPWPPTVEAKVLAAIDREILLLKLTKVPEGTLFPKRLQGLLEGFEISRNIIVKTLKDS